MAKTLVDYAILTKAVLILPTIYLLNIFLSVGNNWMEIRYIKVHISIYRILNAILLLNDLSMNAAIIIRIEANIEGITFVIIFFIGKCI